MRKIQSSGVHSHTTTAEVGERYGVAERTARRWKSAGMPMDKGWQAIESWLSSRKNLPASVLERIRISTPDTADRSDSSADSRESAGVAGAAAALKRLEAAELAAFDRLEDALRGGNALLIRECREGWLKLGESLRKFDLLVEQNRRDAGELIPREVLEEFVRKFCTWARITFQARAQDLVGAIQGKRDVEIYAALKEVFSESLYNGIISHLETGGNAEAQLAATCREVIHGIYEFQNHRSESDIRGGIERAKILVRNAEASGE